MKGKEMEQEFGGGDGIEVVGARVHNLRDLSVRIPLGQLTVVTGVSGAGKSSLVFDTLHAESQRRFVETLSPSARLFLSRLERPDVERIERLPATLALASPAKKGSSGEIVAEACELLEQLGMLACHAGQTICPACGLPVAPDHVETVTRELSSLSAGHRYQLAVSFGEAGEGYQPQQQQQVEEHKQHWEASGFHRFWLPTDEQRTHWDRLGLQHLPGLVITDRLTTDKTSPERLAESLELAYSVGGRVCWLLGEGSSFPGLRESRPPIQLTDESQREWSLWRLAEERRCVTCDAVLPELSSNLFRTLTADRLRELSAHPQSAEATDPAAIAWHVRFPAARIRQPADAPLPTNRGPALGELLALPVSALLDYLRNLAEDWGGYSRSVTEILRELQARLETLMQLGLPALQLGRSCESLSLGERQRVLLAALKHSRLTETLILLDEPSRGLHPAEAQSVRRLVREMVSAESTVVLIDHHPELIAEADYIIELGPGAGPAGGDLLFSGPIQNWLAVENAPAISLPDSTAVQTALAARWQSEPETTERPPRLPLPDSALWCQLRDARQSSEESPLLEFPPQRLTVYSPQSNGAERPCPLTLLEELLQGSPVKTESEGGPSRLESLELTGRGMFDQVIRMTGDDLATSLRSTPVTYLQAYDDIRQLFAETVDAQARGYTPGQFSYNSARGGRCEQCKGLGVMELDLQVLPSLQVPCPACQGKRFNAETLEIRYRNRNINDVLAMPAEEAFAFFRHQQKLQRKLQLLREVGLGYVPLGQPTTQLSQGEQQRLKLAAHLASATGQHVLYLFEEPASGLHPTDVTTLLRCLFRLIEQGHTVLVRDQHPLLQEQADWVIAEGRD